MREIQITFMDNSEQSFTGDGITYGDDYIAVDNSSDNVTNFTRIPLTSVKMFTLTEK